MSEQDEAKTRRYLRRVLVALVAIVLVTGLATLVTYRRVEALFLEQGVRSVSGEVVGEAKGPLGIWNELQVRYVVDGIVYTRTIPVKGDGLSPTSARVRPYFYEPGDQVALLYREDRPGSVRTASRWTPVFYEWGVLSIVALGALLVLAALRPYMLRRAASAD